MPLAWDLTGTIVRVFVLNPCFVHQFFMFMKFVGTACPGNLFRNHDVFLMSVILFFETFLVCFYLKKLYTRMFTQSHMYCIHTHSSPLQKGSGYHADMFIVGLLIFVHSVMGLPWVVGATILSISHVQSLHLYKSSGPPGEAPKFLGVR